MIRKTAGTTGPSPHAQGLRAVRRQALRLIGRRRSDARRSLLASSLLAPPISAGRGVGQDAAVCASSEAVRCLQFLPDPGEPLKGWACAGPIVVDISAVGGIIGVAGPGVLRAAIAALSHRKRDALIITAGCAAELFGVGPVPAEARVVATSDEAIALVHAELSERVRRQENGGDARSLRQLWLVAHADAQQTRLQALIGEAVQYGIHALVAGWWSLGASLAVDDDGRVSSASPGLQMLIGARLATAPRDSAQDEAEYLTSEARTDGRADAGPPSTGTPDTAAAALPALDGEAPRRTQRIKPRLQMLGPASIALAGRRLPGLLERRFSWEIATYLACHPEGVSADLIIEDLWPSESLSCARKRFSDALYYLRKALREAAGGSDAKFVQLRMGRYWIDRSLVDTDLWDFETAVRLGRTAHNDRCRLEQFQQAVETYRGEFAHVGDGSWAEPYLQDLRRKVIDASMELVRLIEDSHPGRAITILERAVKVAPCHEEADRKMMRIYHRLHRIESVRSAYEALEERLARLGEEPSRETRALFRSLTVDTNVAT
ncbi:bacterial transcriptional activator domain-containing protein [Actinoallomurus sp. NPDC052274]|uniref:AfsR/SARP family transcriptional regulator n=1 Tax=Actinoallomurus sp. NPDC052274 TaxID=3155420 RepID=UPI003446602B